MKALGFNYLETTSLSSHWFQNTNLRPCNEVEKEKKKKKKKKRKSSPLRDDEGDEGDGDDASPEVLVGGDDLERIPALPPHLLPENNDYRGKKTGGKAGAKLAKKRRLEVGSTG